MNDQNDQNFIHFIKNKLDKFFLDPSILKLLYTFLFQNISIIPQFKTLFISEIGKASSTIKRFKRIDFLQSIELSNYRTLNNEDSSILPKFQFLSRGYCCSSLLCVTYVPTPPGIQYASSNEGKGTISRQTLDKNRATSSSSVSEEVSRASKFS